jgi:glycine dehydrogenase subunit 2
MQQKDSKQPTYQQAKFDEPLLFEYPMSSKGVVVGNCGTGKGLVPAALCRERLNLPQISEIEVIRHYTRLSQMNYGVDIGFYPLGSCTMKYTPKIIEDMAALPGATDIHPAQDESTVQGALQMMYELQGMLAELGGMAEVSLQPAAGAHGEYTGLLIVHKYHEVKGESARNQIILPDTAHGTNPASAAMVGYDVVEIKSNKDGTVDLDSLKAATNDKTAAFMLTNPNTLGIFENEVCEVASILHDAGALLYYDGANFNAILSKCRPGDMGYDIVHFNLHKSFATPHGGGGPGSGPVGVCEKLTEYLPVPVVAKDNRENRYFLDYDKEHTIGKVKSFYGNFGVMVKAYTYLKVIGKAGVKNVAEFAVLNSCYMKEKLKKHYPLPNKDARKHEFVLSGENMASKGLKTLDIAKRLIDYGMHPPTIYFPIIVHEALMIEPTETEPKAELDKFIDALIKIKDEDPVLLHEAPHNAVVKRLDEVLAAKNPILSYMMLKEDQKKQ